MELSSLNHIGPEHLGDYEPDLYIATLSHETRSTHISRSLNDISCRKIALFSSDPFTEFAYKENKKYFSEKGFDLVEVPDDLPDVGRIFQELEGDHISVLFDCTSMPPRWYYQFFNWLGENQDLLSVNLRFVYSMTGYVDEETPKKVREVREYLRTEQRSKKTKKALILGLGHEAHVSESIYRIIEPDLVYLFYSDPPVDKRFVEKIYVNNHTLINATPIRNLVAYPISNGQLIYQSIIDTILPLRNEYNIVLVPQGPKIFSVASMLVHLGYPDTVISYPVFKRPRILDREPCGDPVILDIQFEGDE